MEGTHLLCIGEEKRKMTKTSNVMEEVGKKIFFGDLLDDHGGCVVRDETRWT